MTKQIHYTAKINAPRRTPENAEITLAKQMGIEVVYK